MQGQSRRVAELRSHLLDGDATPAMVRAALNDVPWQHRDSWLDSLWGVEDVPEDDANLPRGCVPYLPCPAGTVLHAIDCAQVTSADVFVDVGSGTGRAAFLVQVLTGASCIGVEVQAALVQAATRRAASLNRNRMRFVEGDALDCVRFMTTGTVFFLYCPFSGERLSCFLDALEEIALSRRIRVCCVDLPTLDRPWLTRVPSTAVDLHVYQSTRTRAADA